jgi:16S rRNA processing protein RimM
VRVEILTDHPELRYAVGRVLHREGSHEPLTIAWSSPVGEGPGWRLQFHEVPDRATAEDLKGAYLESIAGPTAVLARGEYFWHEVIGTSVTDVDGSALGTVHDVYRTGGAEVYVVSGGPYGEFDVPGVRAFVRVFAPRRGEIVVDREALGLTLPKERVSGAERVRAPRRRPGPRKSKAPSSPSAPSAAPLADPPEP